MRVYNPIGQSEQLNGKLVRKLFLFDSRYHFLRFNVSAGLATVCQSEQKVLSIDAADIDSFVSFLGPYVSTPFV